MPETFAIEPLPRGAVTGFYVFTEASTAEENTVRTLIAPRANKRLDLLGFYAWYWIQTIGAFTSMTYTVQVGATNVFIGNPMIIAQTFTPFEFNGFEQGTVGSSITFRWIHTGGVPPYPVQRGGIKCWASET